MDNVGMNTTTSFSAAKLQTMNFQPPNNPLVLEPKFIDP